MNFWFNKGSLFAISNINHLIDLVMRKSICQIISITRSIKKNGKIKRIVKENQEVLHKLKMPI